jgi:hypothetical protein
VIQPRGNRIRASSCPGARSLIFNVQFSGGAAGRFRDSGRPTRPAGARSRPVGRRLLGIASHLFRRRPHSRYRLYSVNVCTHTRAGDNCCWSMNREGPVEPAVRLLPWPVRVLAFHSAPLGARIHRRLNGEYRPRIPPGSVRSRVLRICVPSAQPVARERSPQEPARNLSPRVPRLPESEKWAPSERDRFEFEISIRPRYSCIGIRVASACTSCRSASRPAAGEGDAMMLAGFTWSSQ